MSILHVDLNSFYAHCEVVRSAGKYSFDTPLIVGGDPRSRHGIVLAATYPVKRKGIRAGMSLKEALILCPEAVVIPSDFDLYTAYSSRFMGIISDYSPVIMRYGIDEAYLDYTGCEHLFGSAATVAHTIRRRVKAELGLTVSVGVGTNPLQAKMGSDYKKPDAVTEIDMDFWRENIYPMPVESLLYVGRSTAHKLNKLGIYRVCELAAVNIEMLRGLFGVQGRIMWLNANGLDDTKLLSSHGENKSMSCSFTLPGDIKSSAELNAALLAQVDKVAYRMRASLMKTQNIRVYLRYNDLTSSGRQQRLPVPTDVTQEIYSAAKRIAAPLFVDKPVRLVGVALSSLTVSGEQISIFHDERHDKLVRADAAMDEVRQKYGKYAIMHGSTVVQGLENEVVNDFTPFVR